MILARGDVHASAVAFDNLAILILGQSGSGKSSLAIALMAQGAKLIGDDLVELVARDGDIHVTRKDQMAGRIEVRKLGILNASSIASAPLALVVDMALEEEARLPERHEATCAGHKYPLIYGKNIPNLSYAIKLMLTQGRVEI